MSKLRPTPQSLLYESPSSQVRVLKGLYSLSSLPVAIKEQRFATLSEANPLLKEALALSTLQHPCIIQLFDCYLESEGEEMVLTIVTELLEGDLKGAMDLRRQESRPWSEGELWAVMKKLISALSFAQRRGISHRDLKPQNIFVTGNTVKIGDFGSTVTNMTSFESKYRSSVCGTPFYLSPELKSAYLAMLEHRETDLQYDPIQSDVYSLGLVLLEIALLRPPSELMEMERLAENTEKVVGGIGYEFVKPWLAAMLAVDAGARPSFVDLEKYVESAESDLAAQAAKLSISIPSTTVQNPLPPVSPCLPPIPTSNECPVCSNPTHLQPISTPRYLAQYSAIAEGFCSVRCLEQATGVWPQRLCPKCYDEIRSFSLSEAQELPCGHFYHLICFGETILERRIGSEREKLACPVCVKRTSSVFEVLPAEAVKEVSLSVKRRLRRH